MSDQVLHLDFVSLQPATGPHDRKRIVDSASALSSVAGVRAIGVLEGVAPSDFDTAFYFVLDGFATLEPFGTDERYSRFLQGEVAPHLRAFAGADVRLEQDFVPREGTAAVVALMAPEETYDWEVREALQSWAAARGDATTALGLAVGEKQAYRGLALAIGGVVEAAGAGLERFRVTSVRGQARSL